MRAVSALVITVILITGGRRDATAVDTLLGLSDHHPDLLASEQTPPHYPDVLRAEWTPPTGWATEPLKQNKLHTHQIWISPTRHTAYGVFHFNLSFPVGSDLVLAGFPAELKRMEGPTTLMDKHGDSNHNAVRFVAESGQHRVRTNLLVRGFDAWAIYACTVCDESTDADELSLAEQGRSPHGSLVKQNPRS